MNNPDYFIGDYLREFTEGEFQYHEFYDSGKAENFLIRRASSPAIEQLEKIVSDRLKSKGFGPREPPSKFEGPLLNSWQGTWFYERGEEIICVGLHRTPIEGDVKGSVFICNSA